MSGEHQGFSDSGMHTVMMLNAWHCINLHAAPGSGEPTYHIVAWAAFPQGLHATVSYVRGAWETGAHCLRTAGVGTLGTLGW